MYENSSDIDDRRSITDHDEYFNGLFAAKPVYVPPGRFKCTTSSNEMLVAKVGSGVVVCVHDPGLGLGGIAHLLMPARLLQQFPRFRDREDAAFKYAENVIESFVGALKREGAGKSRIKIKLFGGTSILEEFIDSGLKNYIFAKEYLLQKGLGVASEDIGGEVCRRIHFIPSESRIVCKRMKRAEDIEDFRKQEMEFLNNLTQQLSG